MSETKVDRLDRTLSQLLAASPGLSAAAVVSMDGLMMASALPPGLDEGRIGAMSAALLTLGEQAVAGFGCGHLDQLFAEGDQGYVVMVSARDEAVLTGIADPASKLGYILYQLRAAADDVADILLEPEIRLDPPTPNPLSMATMSARNRARGDAQPTSPLANGHHLGDAPGGRTPPPAAWG